jgi:hypothetical protein
VITYKAVVKPTPDMPTGDETSVELRSMVFVFAIGEGTGKAPEDIIRGTLMDLHIAQFTTIESIEQVEG